MKKYVFIIMLLYIFVLCSCSKTNEEQNDNIRYSVTTSVFPTTNVSGKESNEVNTSKTTGSDLEPVTDLCFAEDEAIRAYANAIEIDKTLYDGGGLYDLDFDGVPEYIWANGGENDTEFYYVYKYIDNTVIEAGVMIQSYDDLCTLSGITLYYDNELNKYFYVSESIAKDKMARNKHAETTRYIFFDNKMDKEILSRCDFDTHWDNKLLDFETIEITSNILLGENTLPVGITKIEDMTSYYEGLSDHLETFEKIGIFEFKCMTGGEYEAMYDNMYYNYYISDNYNMIIK